MAWEPPGGWSRLTEAERTQARWDARARELVARSYDERTYREVDDRFEFAGLGAVWVEVGGSGKNYIRALKSGDVDSVPSWPFVFDGEFAAALVAAISHLKHSP